MINGRILITDQKIAQIVADAMSDHPEFQQSRIKDAIDDHCDIWHFGKKDWEVIEALVLHMFVHCNQFFDKPNQTGT